MRRSGRWLVLSVTALVLAAGCRERSSPARREARGPTHQLPAATHVEVPFLGPSARQVLRPIGVAVGENGRVFLLDGATGLAKEFAARGEPVGEVRLAEPGALETQDHWVWQCLARDHGGGWLVLDTQRGVVRRLDAQGHRRGEIRVPAAQEAPYYAMQMACDAEGNVYVATGPGLVVRKYDGEGHVLWVQTPAGTQPTSVQLGALAIDPQGRLWMWLSESSTIFILDPDGRLPARRIKRSLGNRSEWGYLVGACFDRHGNRYELSFSTPAGYGTDIAKLDPEGRQLWVQHLTAVRGTGLAVDSSGRVFVTLQDYKFTAAACIAFGPDGREAGLIGSNGTRPGEIRDPSGLAVDRDGNVYVGDYYDFRVQKFAPDGRSLGRIMGSDVAESPAQQITAEGPRDPPASVTVGPDGLVYVTHGSEPTISVFSRAGGRVRSYPKVSLGYGGTTDYHFGASPRFPASVAVDSEGHMWTAIGLEPEVVEENGKPTRLRGGGVRVSEHDRTGRKLLSFGGYGTGAGQFGRDESKTPEPEGVGDSLLAVDADGHVWVVDRYNNRVQHFDQEGKSLGQIGPKIGDVSLEHPWGVAVGGPGHLYIGDDGAILEFTARGTSVGLVALLGGDRPYYESDLAYRYRALAADAAGNVYLSDGGLGAVRKFVGRAKGSG